VGGLSNQGWGLGAVLVAGFTVSGCGGEAAPEPNGAGPAEPQGPHCGDGNIDPGEACDGLNLGGMRCVDLDPQKPLGNVICADNCRFDASDCVAWVDTDGDDVRDQRDLEPENPFVCRDTDGDGCDDCSIEGFAAPSNDGFDPDEDGFCDADTQLDPDCMRGRNADDDPYREKACIMFELMNQDRARFLETESGGAAKLEWNEDIWEVAVAHSRDMCNRNFFAHDNPEGLSPSGRAAEAGLSYGLGENIAKGRNEYTNQYAFMDEPTCRGHRMNILNSRYAQAAVGYHVCDRDGLEYATQNFRGGGGSVSSYCANQANHCSVPPDPPSVAGMHEACTGCSVIDRAHPQFTRYCP